MRTYAGNPAEVWPIMAWPLDPPTGYPISPSSGQILPYKSDPKYLGFGESIDHQTNSIWIAIANTFPDVFNTDPNNLPCISGVTLARYNLDSTTYLPTGDPIVEPGTNLLPIYMQYGYLLDNGILLTHLGCVDSYNPFNQTYIGNAIKDLW